MRPPARANSCLSSQAAARPMDFTRQPPQPREPSPYNKSLYMYTYRLRFTRARPAPPSRRSGGPRAPLRGLPPHPRPRTLPRARVAGQGPPSRPFSKHALHPPPGPSPAFWGAFFPLAHVPEGLAAPSRKDPARAPTTSPPPAPGLPLPRGPPLPTPPPPLAPSMPLGLWKRAWVCSTYGSILLFSP